MNGVVKRSKEADQGLQPTDFKSYQILRENELVFKLIDLQNTATSRVGMSPYDGIVSPAYIILRRKEKALPRYYYYFFHSLWQRHIFNQLGDAGVRSSLGVSDLLELKIPFPPLAEQEKIAGFLDRKCGKIDEMMEKVRAQIEKLEAYKKSLITEAVTKGVRGKRKMKDSGVAWIGQVPEEWEVKRLKYCAKIRTGSTPDKNYQDEYYSTDNGIPWIKAENLGTIKSISNTAEYLTQEGAEVGRVFPPCTVYVCCIASIGAAGYSLVSASCNQQINALIFNRLSYWKYGFYATLAANEEYQVCANGNVVRIVNSSAQANIKLPQPPLAEQEEIAQYLDQKCGKTDEIIAKRKVQLEKLGEYKKSLIYEYVTGKKEVAA